MTSKFKFFGSGWHSIIRSFKSVFPRGLNSSYHPLPTLEGRALEIAEEEWSKTLPKVVEGDHLCFILRHDQYSMFTCVDGILDKWKLATGFKFELVHKSVDFTNLNYAGTGNYLNFYIYKAVKND